MTAHAEAVSSLMDGNESELQPSETVARPSVSVTMQAERLTGALFIEVLPLLREHWKEVAHYEDIPLDVDQVAYLTAAQNGMVRCFTVREEGKLVGYALYFVRPNLHYKGSLQAAQDVIYLDPSVRGGTGVRFIAWCDEQLKAEGVQVVFHHAKARPDLPFATILERRGYEKIDIIYGKRLDR